MRGVAQLGLAERVAERLGGRLHRGRVERAGDVERASRAGRASRGLRAGARRARRAAPDSTTWPGALSLATVTPCGGRDRPRRRPRSPPSEREHRAAVPPASAIRRPRSTTRRSGVVARRARRRRRARSSSPSEWPASAAAVPSSARRVPAGEAGAEDRGLGEAGRLVGARERVLADERGDELEQVGRARRDEVAHVRRLAALAGEEDDRGSGVGDQAHTDNLSAAYASSPAVGGREPPSRGVRGPAPLRAVVYAIRPSRCARCTASARLRTLELAVQRARVLLDRVRREEAAARRSRGWSRRRRSARAPRARGPRAAGLRAPRAGAKTVMPRPTMRTAPAMSAAGQSLETKPDGAGGARRARRDPPGAGDQQHVAWRARPRAAARRSRRPTPGRRTGRRARRAARSGAPARPPPRALRALRQRSTHGCSPSISRKPQWTTSWSSTTSTRRRRSPVVPVASRPGLRSGAVNRHRQPDAPVPGSRSPNSTMPPSCSASSAASRRPIPVVPRRGRVDAVVDHLEHERAVGDVERAPRRCVGCACLCALRTASASTDCASGSQLARHARRARTRASSRDLAGRGCSRRRRSSSSRSVVCVVRRACARAGAAARAAGRTARPGARRRALARLGVERSRLAREHERARRTAAGSTPSCTSRARSMRSCSCARALVLVGREPRGGGERRDLAERPQRVALGVAQRRPRPARGRTRITPSQRPAADIGVQTSVASRGGRGTRPGPRRLVVADLDRRGPPRAPGGRSGADSTRDVRAVEQRRGRCRGRRRRARGGGRRRSGRSPRGPSTPRGRSPRTGGCRSRRSTPSASTRASSSTNVSSASMPTVGSGVASLLMRTGTSSPTPQRRSGHAHGITRRIRSSAASGAPRPSDCS